MPETDFASALRIIESFASAGTLTARIAQLEDALANQDRASTTVHLEADGITSAALHAALAIKSVAGQINVIVHALGLLVSLPHVLAEGEVIESLSLGAGNTGRAHDLETNRQIAEFKFIEWRGGPESIRQNALFVDLFNLATAATNKRRVLYVVGQAIPLRFLGNRRALSSVLSKNAAVEQRFRALHGNSFATVRDYYETVKNVVEIVDLRDVVPAFRFDEMPSLEDSL